MRTRQRVVVDTNVLVSRLLAAESIPGQAVREARRRGRLLVSEATLNELVEVLAREKLDRYISLAQRKQFLRQLGRIAELVLIIQLVRECRDPKDDKFLEVALNGRADVIITGDADLLRMHPWRDIEILSSSDYLKEMRGRGTRRPEHYDSETKSVARKAGILVGDARGFCFPRSRI